MIDKRKQGEIKGRSDTIKAPALIMQQSKLVRLLPIVARSFEILSQYPSPQRYCHAIPTAVSSLPVRVVTPVLAESLSEFCRLMGKATVKPARVIACSLSLLTPLRVVRPPAR